MTSATPAGYRLGYACVSTLDQDPALQHDALLAAGWQRIFVRCSAPECCADGPARSAGGADLSLLLLQAGADGVEEAGEVARPVCSRRAQPQPRAAPGYGRMCDR
jgi:hypothetical protein